MCGFVAVRSSTREALDIAEEGLKRIVHRGPDGSRAILAPDTKTALAHARLAILDLSPAGGQPFRSELNGDFIVFNGEIYNFIELRSELQQRGIVFTTETDTEVLLKGWMVWREALFPRLNGMWSFVLYEQATGALILSRDRLGVKPLYVFHSPGMLAFASEIGPLKMLAGGMRVNEEAVHDFLLFGTTDHRRQTFFQGIESFPVGAWAMANSDGGIHVNSFHEWPVRGEAPVTPDEVRDLVESAVALRLRSDAPSVSLLSSGLDSSIVTSCCVRAATREARSQYLGAFTYASEARPGVYGTNEYAEAARFFAGLVSPFQHLSNVFDSVFAEDEMFDLITALEEPVCNPSVIAAWRSYAFLAARGVRVVLHGEGADEVFGGYPLFCAWSATDAAARGDLRPALQGLAARTVSPRGLAARLFQRAPEGVTDALFLRSRGRAGLFSRAFLDRHADRRAREFASRGVSVGDAITRMTLASNLPHLLRYTDRASMRFGIEARSPFLDYRVVEAGLRASTGQLVNSRQTKILLREAFATRLPDDVRNRRKYAGFGSVEEMSFASVAWARVWDEAPAWARDYVDVDALRSALSRGHGDLSVWNALSFLIWACIAANGF